MTENDGGTPRDPQPEIPPTQPLPESPLGAEPPPAARPQPTASYGQPDGATAYGQSEATPYEQPGAPVAPPQYGYAAAPPKNDLAVWSLIAGILSYVMCPLLLGIVAIIMGTMGRRAADEGLANNRGMATAGVILGWINVGLTVLGIVFFVLVLGLGLFAGGIGTVIDMNDMTY